MVSLALAAGLGGCDPGGSAGAPRPSTTTVPGVAASAVTVFDPSSGVCVGSDAHDKHGSLGLGCQICHPCATLQIASITLPGGRSTAGAEVVPGSGETPASCKVACHYPPGETPTSIAWNAQGPLPCTGCHGSPVPVGVTVRSFHPGLGSGGGTDCSTCHDTSAHMSGTVRLKTSGGTVNTACTACHAGSGGTLNGVTPPLLVGWTDPAGDFHGSRSGTGFGGTLREPWVRGQGPLPCTACHDAHASANAFLLARKVNGVAIPQGSIDRAGVGAQALCEACHAGARHDTCAGCHGADPMPAGAPCFSCHGHEGIRLFVAPSGTPENYHGESGYCGHCHGSWMPDTEYAPPVLTYGGMVLATSITATGATVTWNTDEPSTSYVEFGTAERGFVAGSAAFTTRHEVALSGLAPSTSYTFRVRSSDPMRNVRLSPVIGFSTTCQTCLGAPTLTPIRPVWTMDDWFTIALTWSAVTSPDGDPLQYRVVLDLDPSFASPLADSGWISETAFTVGLPTGNTYYWRVQARDAVHLAESPWSDTASFWSATPDIGE